MMRMVFPLQSLQRNTGFAVKITNAKAMNNHLGG